MGRSRVDTSLTRITKGDFAFPLGVNPVEEFTPTPGYVSQFEPSDGDSDDGQWEEWPDRYVFDVLITAARVEPLCRSLFSLLPGRVYPILDVLGNDAYREVDPYIAYDLVGFDRFMDTLRRHRGWFYEDGLVGFGAMSLEPFIYIFVDEHKFVTVRVQTDLRERVEQILHAFDLAATLEPRGVDSALHEHRSVLEAPPDRTDLLTFDEIVEELVDEWRLRLNVDTSGNVDEEGNELGVTGSRCLVRRPLREDDTGPAYAEVLLTAKNLEEAERLAFEAVEAGPAGKKQPRSDAASPDEEMDDWLECVLVAADRVTPDEYKALLREDSGEGATAAAPSMNKDEVHSVRWLVE